MIGLSEAAAGPQPGASAAAALLSATDAVFTPEGSLREVLQFEHRPQQARMARAVAEAFAGDTALLCEAGTGVGKSLAYLIPGLINACRNGRKLIVSTHTISLQEQLLHKDLKLCRRLFERSPALQDCAGFRAALMVGRRNYLCNTRLAHALASRNELFPGAEQAELERIRSWAERTETGLVQELDPPPLTDVWDSVCAEGGACTSTQCSADSCCYRRARRAMDRSEVLIVNHSLLFALLAAGAFPHGDARGILLPDDTVVLDEAHTVYDVATEHLGLQLSHIGLRRALLRLYNPQRQKGLLKRLASRTELQSLQEALYAGEVFFEEVEGRWLNQQHTVRLRDADWGSPLLVEPLDHVLHLLARHASQLEDGPQREELRYARQRLNAHRAGLLEGLSLAQDDHVYWLSKTGRKRSNVTLHSAPLDLAATLRERLFERSTGLVLTSATLAEGASMQRWQQRMGAESAAARAEGSPFDFPRQVRIFIATDAPEPSRGARRLDADYLIDMVRWWSLRCTGGTLVLFTSYADLARVGEGLEAPLAEAGRALLRQGQDGSRSALVEQFRAAGNAVLLGTDSFWTGVDVPGPALAQVILTRLPFRNPSHPVEEARAEACERRGGSAFRELQLPAAQLKFRQGWGRLIRKHTDTGWLTLLDSRLLHKSYGKRFIELLPHTHWERFERSSRDSLDLKRASSAP